MLGARAEFLGQRFLRSVVSACTPLTASLFGDKSPILAIRKKKENKTSFFPLSFGGNCIPYFPNVLHQEIKEKVKIKIR
jgi:hypothetical protein